MPKKYDNQSLAQDYFSVVKQGKWGNALRNYRKVKDAIANSPVDIASLYKNEGNLRRLRVEGIGNATIPKLELILSEELDIVLITLTPRNGHRFPQKRLK